MAIRKEVLDELLKDYRGPDDLTGEEGLLKQLTKALVERAMGAELTEHLGYEKHQPGEKPSENRRNGRSPGPPDELGSVLRASGPALQLRPQTPESGVLGPKRVLSVAEAPSLDF
jgi:hypothetical protein